jgi:hypothetical protein
VVVTGFLSPKTATDLGDTFYVPFKEKNTEWLNQYEFSYNNVNQDGIMKIFG